MGSFADRSGGHGGTAGQDVRVRTEARFSTKKGRTSDWTNVERHELEPMDDGVPDRAHRTRDADELLPRDAPCVQRPRPAGAHPEGVGAGLTTNGPEPRELRGGARVVTSVSPWTRKDEREGVRRWGRVLRGRRASTSGARVRGALRGDRGLHDRVRALHGALGHDAAVRGAAGRLVPDPPLGLRAQGEARVPHGRGDIEITDGEAYYVGPGPTPEIFPTPRSWSLARPLSSTKRWRSSRRTWRRKAPEAWGWPRAAEPRGAALPPPATETS